MKRKENKIRKSRKWTTKFKQKNQKIEIFQENMAKIGNSGKLNEKKQKFRM